METVRNGIWAMIRDAHLRGGVKIDWLTLWREQGYLSIRCFIASFLWRVQLVHSWGKVCLRDIIYGGGGVRDAGERNSKKIVKKYTTTLKQDQVEENAHVKEYAINGLGEKAEP